jgi:hypothetical protein
MIKRNPRHHIAPANLLAEWDRRLAAEGHRLVWPGADVGATYQRRIEYDAVDDTVRHYSHTSSFHHAKVEQIGVEDYDLMRTRGLIHGDLQDEYDDEERARQEQITQTKPIDLVYAIAHSPITRQSYALAVFHLEMEARRQHKSREPRMGTGGWVTLGQDRIAEHVGCAQPTVNLHLSLMIPEWKAYIEHAYQTLGRVPTPTETAQMMRDMMHAVDQVAPHKRPMADCALYLDAGGTSSIASLMTYQGPYTISQGVLYAQWRGISPPQEGCQERPQYRGKTPEQWRSYLIEQGISESTQDYLQWWLTQPNRGAMQRPSVSRFLHPQSNKPNYQMYWNEVSSTIEYWLGPEGSYTVTPAMWHPHPEGPQSLRWWEILR